MNLVENGLPTEDGRVLVFAPCYKIGDSMRWRIVDAPHVKYMTEVTHWMYMDS